MTFSIKSWLRSKAKVTGIYGTAAAAGLGALVAWSQLDLPVPATTADVAEVKQTLGKQIAGLEQFSRGTRRITLGQEWDRLNRQIGQLKAKGDKTADEIKYLSDLRSRLKDVSNQLEALK